MEQILTYLASLSHVLLHVALGAGAAVENVVPMVPADTVILLGGFLAGTGLAEPWTVFLVVWSANVASALVVYAAGWHYGRAFFRKGLGRRVLNPDQMDRMDVFYRRWGVVAIFMTRFLPGLRAVVPVFAGVSHHPPLGVAVPLAGASAIWYGALVWLGATAGRNLDTILRVLQGTNRLLLAVSVLLVAAVGLGWWRTRARRRKGEE